MLVRSAALVCALLLTTVGCRDDAEPEASGVAYSAPPPTAPPEPGSGKDVAVDTATKKCPGASGGVLVSAVPDGWSVDSSQADYCAWSQGTSSLTFEYGDIDGDPWEWILLQTSAQDDLQAKYPNFEQIRQSSDVGGGPLWHFQYVVSRVDGAVYVDSLQLFRDGWHVTYEADSDDYNRYLERRLIASMAAAE